MELHNFQKHYLFSSKYHPNYQFKSLHFFPIHEVLFLVIPANAGAVCCFQTFVLPWSLQGFARKWSAIKWYFNIIFGIYFNPKFKFKFSRPFPKGSKRFQKVPKVSKSKQTTNSLTNSVQDIWWRCNNRKRIVMSSFWKKNRNYINHTNYIFTEIPLSFKE